MKTAAKLTPFQERALDHLLDFNRERDVKLEADKDATPFDLPRLTLTMPLEPGDQLGVDALYAAFQSRGFTEIRVRHKDLIIPCLVSSVTRGDSELVFSLRVVGAAEPA